MAAAEAAIANPLLDETSMKGAKGLLISITGGRDLTLFEVDEAATRIREEVDQDANIILGATFDEDLEGVIRVSVVATGIDKAAADIAAPPIAIRQPAKQPQGRPAAEARPVPEPAPRCRPGGRGDPRGRDAGGRGRAEVRQRPPRRRPTSSARSPGCSSPCPARSRSRRRCSNISSRPRSPPRPRYRLRRRRPSLLRHSRACRASRTSRRS